MNLQQLLDKWNIKCDANTLLSMWNESHRHYHNLNHLNDLVNQINENQSILTEKEYDMLLLTSLFHDCIYDPMREDNEEKSAEFFENCCIDKNNLHMQQIKQMILETKFHDPNKTSSRLSHIFSSYDMKIVERNYDELIEWENGISEEYKFAGEEYKPGRIKFLESILDKYPNNTENLLDLLDYVRSK